MAADYQTLQEAYDHAYDGCVILTRAVTFTEKVKLNAAKKIEIWGGYDQYYTSIVGTTLIKGALAVSKGGLVIKNVNLR